MSALVRCFSFQISRVPTSKFRSFSSLIGRDYRSEMFVSRVLTLNAPSEITRFSTTSSVSNCDNITGITSTSFSWRTHTCGELRINDIGRTVYLCGWVQFKRLTKFLLLRDGYGVTQITFSNDDDNQVRFAADFKELTLESVIGVRGVVIKRPTGQENKNIETGDIEVCAEDVKILGPCKTKLPFLPRDFQKVNEALRLKYRYLDFRDEVLQRNLRIRSRFVMKIREFLCNLHGFVDVETPTLFTRTPGGAQEFVVPTRQPGLFYALTQSPQQFKQLLMVGEIDRYFQIARCYRDEGNRPDRQPEFTQVDIEMSFVSSDGIMSLIEELFVHCWPEGIVAPFPKMPWRLAQQDYGTDKPDTRFEMKLNDLPECLTNCIPFMAASGIDFAARSFVASGLAPFFTNSLQDKIKVEAARDFAVGSVHFIKIDSNGRWISSLTKLVNESVQLQTSHILNLKPGDVVILASGKYASINHLLGKLRLDVAFLLENAGVTVRSSLNSHNFLWIVDFPLFQSTPEGCYETMHHPFTAPHPQDVERLYSGDIENVRGQHYDLVLNGAEVGGGSVRIHDTTMQKYVLESVLKVPNLDSLSHLLEALSSGAPPHAGIALGLDRLVAILCGASNIREVIAFPKSLEGKDLMSGAPAPISNEEKLMYHLKGTGGQL